MPKLSVIIPVYNAEDYLKRCVDSILNQTFKDFEVILIDDNSKDKSLQICKNYEKLDSRIRVFHRENNGGIYNARNDGLRYSQGQYITFVDNDDWLDKDMYEKLLNVMEEHEVDFASCGFKEIINDIPKFHKHIEDGYYTKELIRNKLIFMLVGEQKISCAVWKSIFKREIINTNKLCFHKSKVKDDFYFVVEYLLLCNSAEYIEGDYYNYWIRNNSTIHTIGLANKEDSIDNPLKIFEIFERRNCLSKKFYEALGMEYITSILRLATCCNLEEFKKSITSLQFRRYLFLKNIRGGVNWKLKVLYLLIKCKCGTLVYKVVNRK